MDDQQRGFIRQLLHHAINSGIHSLLWRMPTLTLFLLILALVAAVWHFQLW